MDTIEEWRRSISLPEYMVSSWGRVMRIPHGKYGGKPWRGCWISKEKRCVFNFRSKKYKVHILVCEAFNGPKPFDGAVVIHLDEQGDNNCSDNLKWGTQKENLNAPGFIAYCKSRTGGDSPVVKGRIKQGDF
jgi:hypothetical protein